MASVLFATLNRECGPLLSDWQTDHGISIICAFAESVGKVRVDRFYDSVKRLQKTSISSDLTPIKHLEATTKNTLWQFVTVRPPFKMDDPQIPKFIAKAISFVERRLHDSCMLVFEQKGVDTLTVGAGLHIHFLSRRSMTYSPNSFITQLKKSFTKFVNVNKAGPFDMHWCPVEYLSDKVSYMLGNKAPEKMAAVKFDTVMRNNKGLQPYYTKNFDVSAYTLPTALPLASGVEGQ